MEAQNRKPHWQNKFYPGNKKKLKKMIELFLNNAKATKQNQFKALIVPHAGYIYSGLTAAYGYKSLNSNSYSKVIVIGPSHHKPISTMSFSTYEVWETPLGKIDSLDITQFVPKKHRNINNKAHKVEHSIEVQLPFLQKTLESFEILPILTTTEDSNLEHLLEDIIDSETLLIISSDLSHYLNAKQAQERDQDTIDKILNLKPTIKSVEACGNIGINTLIKIAADKGWQPKLLDYRHSGQTAGTKDSVVGYTSIGFN